MNDHEPWRHWRYRLLLAGVVLLYLVLAIGSSATKRPWIDEAYEASSSLDVIVRGSAGLTVVEPTGVGNRPGETFDAINRYNFMWMPLPFYLHAGWFKMFGFSLWTLRSLSVVCGLILLAACLTIVWKLTADPALALLAALVASADRVVIDAASDGRPDMIAGAFCFAGVAAYLLLRTRSLDWAILGGQTFMAMGVFSHPAGLPSLVGLVFLTLYLDRNQLRWRSLFLAGMPYVLALAGWGVFILQEPAAFLPQFSANLRGRSSSLLAPWAAIWREISVRYLEGYYLPVHAQGVSRLRVLIPVFYATAFLAAWLVPGIRRAAGPRSLLLLTTVYFATSTFAEGLKSYYYLIHMVPLWACVLALWIHWCYVQGALWRWTAAGVLCGFLALQLGWTAFSIWRNDYRNSYLPAVAFLKEHARKPAIVMGSSEFGFDLGFYDNLIEDGALGFYTKKRADFIVIDDRAFAQFVQGYRTYAPFLYHYITNLLVREYRIVYSRRPYTIYGHRMAQGR